MVTALLTILVVASLTLTVWYESHGLYHGYYWDENLSLENVRAILRGGSLRPANGFYQSLSYLPQVPLLATTEALHRWTGWERLAVFDADGRFSSTSYFLCRLVASLFGAGGLILTFLVGRRLFSPAVGVVGTFLLAVTPWFVQASSMFKPDILLMFAVLAALWWSLDAAQRGNLRCYALAGCGVALAMSCKLTGVVVAVPLLVAIVGSESSWRDRGKRLLVAAGAGIALFVLLNPYFPIYFESFAFNVEHYAYRAGMYDETRLSTLARELDLLLGSASHDGIVGAIALGAGVAFAAHLLLRSRRLPGRAPGRPVEGWMFLSFPLAYSLTYAMATPHFKGNNFVPVLPFTSLLAAWSVVALWRLGSERLPILRRRRIVAAAAVAGVAVLAPRPFTYVYDKVIPRTEELARAFLVSRFRAAGETVGRVVYSEARVRKSEWTIAMPRLRETGSAVVPVEQLAGLPSDQLELADGHIFPASRLDEGIDAYWGCLASASSVVRRFDGHPFEARGPERIACAHPWRRKGPPLRLAEGRPADNSGLTWSMTLPPGLAPGEAISVLVRGERLRQPPEVHVGLRPVRLMYISFSADGPAQLVSNRLALEASASELRLRFANRDQVRRPLHVEILRWRPEPTRSGRSH